MCWRESDRSAGLFRWLKSSLGTSGLACHPLTLCVCVCPRDLFPTPLLCPGHVPASTGGRRFWPRPSNGAEGFVSKQRFSVRSSNITSGCERTCVKKNRKEECTQKFGHVSSWQRYAQQSKTSMASRVAMDGWLGESKDDGWIDDGWVGGRVDGWLVGYGWMMDG